MQGSVLDACNDINISVLDAEIEEKKHKAIAISRRDGILLC